MAAKRFRVGKVQVFLRGRVWYLCYYEQGKRHRPRVGPDREQARQMDAQINGQIEVGAPAALSFEPISIPQLRNRWLEHHELVLRSSVHSIKRYRTGTDHIIRYLSQRPVRHASLFTPNHAEDFVRYLRTIKVSPNGHPNTAKRPLMDKGICYILESCRAMLNFAVKRRHLSPYAENPFSVLDIDRIPVENAKPIILMTPNEEAIFLEACDPWQLPVFATLMFTGIRPGELCHLLLTDDLDLAGRVLRIRNKPKLGWQVKTRNQREIPLLPELAEILRQHIGSRTQGPVFLRRKATPEASKRNAPMLERDLLLFIAERERRDGSSVDRAERLRLAKSVWHRAGALDEDHVRKEFTRIATKIGLIGSTAPKILRHQFATVLQEGQVDPLVRNLLMGHATSEHRTPGHGLGMTAVYTHTRPETIREQLLTAFSHRSALRVLNPRIAFECEAEPLIVESS